MQQTYLESLANAVKGVRAWKLAALFLAGLCVLLIIALIYASENTPVILVPYDFATTQGKMKILPGSEFGASSPDYLGQLALGDLALILNWQPANIEEQYARFLNRCTNELYARENVRLQDEAKTNHAQDQTQSYYPENTQVNIKTGQVIVDGSLVRWTGGKETIRTPQRYVVTYRTQQGLPHVSNVEIK